MVTAHVGGRHRPVSEAAALVAMAVAKGPAQLETDAALPGHRDCDCGRGRDHDRDAGCDCDDGEED